MSLIHKEVLKINKKMIKMHDEKLVIGYSQNMKNRRCQHIGKSQPQEKSIKWRLKYPIKWK